MFKYAACTIKGVSRSINQDRIMINNQVIEENGIYGETDNCLTAVVCDGVGNTPAGDAAAEITAQGFIDLDVPSTSAMTITKKIHMINKEILYNQNIDIKNKYMATTLAGIALYNNKYLSFNLGDSRIYKKYDKTIVQLSRDQTFFGQSSNTLTGYLGGDGLHCIPYVQRGVCHNDDYYILCSDGLYKNIPEIVLKEIIQSNKSIQLKTRTILQVALQNGSKDDISIILISHS